MGDTLSDLLRAVRLRGAIFFDLECADPWVVETPPAAELIPAILPGVEHMMEFHGVARGSCWATRVGGEAVHLAEGEFITGLSVEYWNYIDRITFHTNLKSYGPYGGSGGNVTKELRAPGGQQVLGFAGRHWELIDSIQLIVG